MGQAIAFPGTGMTGTFAGVPRGKLIELPVIEDVQLGMAIGMSLESYGMLPVCVYPRFNFLMLAMNQLVLHLDKLPLYSDYRPKVIIRTAVATDHPMNPGPQHLGDFSEPIQKILKTIHVEQLHESKWIVPAYQHALNCNHSTILVERTELYDEE